MTKQGRLRGASTQKIIKEPVLHDVATKAPTLSELSMRELWGVQLSVDI